MYSSVSVIVSIVLLVCYSEVEGIKWKNCGSNTKAQVKSVTVSGCESTDVCVLKKGQNATFTVDFVINEDATSATSVVHGVIDHIPVPFPLDNPNACLNSGLTCPLKSGTEYKYETYIFVKTIFPSIRLVVRWELVDQSKNDIFCIELGAQIQQKSDNTLRFLTKKN
jgi:Niemann-Pick C2 protein